MDNPLYSRQIASVFHYMELLCPIGAPFQRWRSVLSAGCTGAWTCTGSVLQFWWPTLSPRVSLKWPSSLLQHHNPLSRTQLKACWQPHNWKNFFCIISMLVLMYLLILDFWRNILSFLTKRENGIGLREEFGLHCLSDISVSSES